MERPRPIELLAPARDAGTAVEAIRHGADAVYIGASSHGARAAAGNTLADIAGVVDFAHNFGARVYVTLNTLVYDSEISQVENLVCGLYRIGVDALIVQDLGILRMDIPPIALHASTQCDIRTPEKALFLQDLGFSQLVLPRELSLEEIKAVRAKTAVPLEAFVHGALCVSYSGDCQASFLATGRSANRGECAQICRLPYDLYDGAGDLLVKGKHLLSLRDMNRSAMIASMLDAGISSFKIEGRLKDRSYVKNITAFYSRTIDSIIEQSGGRYVRSSSGTVAHTFVPSPEKSFNRGFTDYFLCGASARTASVETPKWIGEKIGSVVSCTGNRTVIRSDKALNNGDGLGFFNADGVFEGFRVNRTDGHAIHTMRPMALARGTVLYRNHDHGYEAAMDGDTASRDIGVVFTLRPVSWGVALDAVDVRGNSITVTAECVLSPAKTPQYETRSRILNKLGGTIYRMKSVDDRMGDCFIAASLLTDLRRRAVAMLDRAQRISYIYDYRRAENHDSECPSKELTYHDNIANRLAAGLYAEHGAYGNAMALETGDNLSGAGIVVMTTRYCVRREFGHCLKESDGRSWKGPLRLSSKGFDLKLEFDCADCRMRVVYSGKKRDNS